MDDQEPMDFGWLLFISKRNSVTEKSEKDYDVVKAKNSSHVGSFDVHLLFFLF